MTTHADILLNDTFALDTMIAEIQQWAGIESPSNNATANNKMADTIAEKFAQMGWATERINSQSDHYTHPVGDMIVARSPWGKHETGAKPNGILICSHMDTVHPIGEPQNNPIRTEGDKLFGPGVYDMKAGLYMAMTACQHVTTAQTHNLPITFLISADEEIGSHASRAKIQELAQQNQYALVTEPARDGGKIVTARRGTGDMYITVRGKSAHAGIAFTDGRNAIVETATNIIPKLVALANPEQGYTVSPNVIHGGTADNTIPNTCVLHVDLRADTVEQMQKIVNTINALTPTSPDYTYEITGGFNRPPWATGEPHQGLFNHAQTQAQDLGIDLVGIATGGGSDANFTAELGIPTLDGLGIDGANAHTSNEYGKTTSIIPRTALMVRLLETLG